MPGNLDVRNTSDTIGRVMFARGFAFRTRIIIVVSALYILSGAVVVAGMIIAPSETAELFPIWIAAGAVIFLSVVASYALLAWRERRGSRSTDIER